MNTELAILRRELAFLKMTKMELETAIGGKVKTVKSILAMANILKISQIDIKGALDVLKEADAAKDKLEEVIAKIEQINQELGS